MGTLPRRVLGLVMELRLVPVVQWSFTGVLLGAALVGREHPISPGVLAASLVVAIAIHGVVAHCPNDLADWRSGTDRHPSPRALSGGSKVLPLGLLEPRHLRAMGVVGTATALVVGFLVAAERGWGLLLLGGGGIVLAACYSIAPVRAASRPVLGEIVAVACGWACVFGSDLAQRERPSLLAAVVGVHYVAACMTMLMLHHIPDRVADLGADPPKRTTVALLGDRAPLYAAAWPVAATAIGALVSATTLPELWPSTIGAALAAVSALTARSGDLARITRAEVASVLVVMAGGLASAALMLPDLAWFAPVALALLAVDGLAGRLAARLATESPSPEPAAP